MKIQRRLLHKNDTLECGGILTSANFEEDRQTYLCPLANICNDCLYVPAQHCKLDFCPYRDCSDDRADLNRYDVR
jgi:hypothetical protein